MQSTKPEMEFRANHPVFAKKLHMRIRLNDSRIPPPPSATSGPAQSYSPPRTHPHTPPSGLLSPHLRPKCANSLRNRALLLLLLALCLPNRFVQNSSRLEVHGPLLSEGRPSFHSSFSLRCSFWRARKFLHTFGSPARRTARLRARIRKDSRKEKKKERKRRGGEG